jgi:hypothetical protein
MRLSKPSREFDLPEGGVLTSKISLFYKELSPRWLSHFPGTSPPRSPLLECSIGSDECARKSDAEDRFKSFAGRGLVARSRLFPHHCTRVRRVRRGCCFFILSAGFKHASIPTAVQVITSLGEKTGAFETTASQDVSVFTPANPSHDPMRCDIKAYIGGRGQAVRYGTTVRRFNRAFVFQPARI